MMRLLHDLGFIIRNGRYYRAHRALWSVLKDWWRDYDHTESEPLSSNQIRELRDYYDNHDSITGTPIQRFGLNLHVEDLDQLREALERIDNAENAAWRNLA